MNTRFMRGFAATLTPCGSFIYSSRFFAACFFTACLFLSACVLQEGGGSDTETLTGSVADPGGAPAARTMVKLIPIDYDPSHPDDSRILRVLTDDAGRFKFGRLEKGKAYNVIAGNTLEKTWAYAKGVRPGTEDKALILARAKVFLFDLHAENYQRADSGIAYFPGTDILTRCDGISFSTVDSVPSGALRFVVESLGSGWVHDTTLVSASVIDTAKVLATENGVILYP
jgi:hypothetical protein